MPDCCLCFVWFVFGVAFVFVGVLGCLWFCWLLVVGCWLFFLLLWIGSYPPMRVMGQIRGFTVWYWFVQHNLCDIAGGRFNDTAREGSRNLEENVKFIASAVWYCHCCDAMIWNDVYRVKVFAFPACTGICIACFSAGERLVAKIRIESRPCESICIETICDMWL